MSRADDLDGNAARDRFVERLDRMAAQSRALDFWWRDDDAETATPELDRLLGLASRRGLPLALAVVPRDATAALAERLSREPRVSVLQHGWAHENHAREGEKKIELGGTLSVAEARDRLSRGFERLNALLPKEFLPVLVPPWNRIDGSVRAETTSVGLIGLSTFGPVTGSESHQVNTHLDIFQWRPERRPRTRREIYSLLSAEIDRRQGGNSEALGILTHHLVHEEASWALLDELSGLLARHPAARWPETATLFNL